MEKSIVLVTGANSGIGFELAAQLLSDSSKHVLLGSRSSQKGEVAIQELQARNLAGVVELIQLDVSDQDSIAAAAKHVENTHGRLDALVNNAAVALLPGSLFDQLTQSFQTNATGPAVLVEAFAPLLGRSTSIPRIVNISSVAGSITRYLDPKGYKPPVKVVSYHVSKTALNMVTAMQAVEYGPLGWKVFAFCPGFTASNISPLNTLESGAKPTSEGASPIVDILAGKRDGEHGCFLTPRGQYSW